MMLRRFVQKATECMQTKGQALDSDDVKDIMELLKNNGV